MRTVNGWKGGRNKNGKKGKKQSVQEGNRRSPRIMVGVAIIERNPLCLADDGNQTSVLRNGEAVLLDSSALSS